MFRNGCSHVYCSELHATRENDPRCYLAAACSQLKCDIGERRRSIYIVHTYTILCMYGFSGNFLLFTLLYKPGLLSTNIEYVMAKEYEYYLTNWFQNDITIDIFTLTLSEVLVPLSSEIIIYTSFRPFKWHWPGHYYRTKARKRLHLVLQFQL